MPHLPMTKYLSGARLIWNQATELFVYLSLTQKGLIAIAFAVAVIIALFGVVAGGPGR